MVTTLSVEDWEKRYKIEEDLENFYEMEELYWH